MCVSHSFCPSSTATRIQQAAPPTPSRLKKPARVLNAQGTPLPSAIENHLTLVCVHLSIHMPGLTTRRYCYHPDPSMDLRLCGRRHVSSPQRSSLAHVAGWRQDAWAGRGPLAMTWH